MLLVEFEVIDSDMFGSSGWEQKQVELYEKLKLMIKELNISRGQISVHVTSVNDIAHDDIKMRFWKDYYKKG